MNFRISSLLIILAALAIALSSVSARAANKLVHDAEYYILEAQNGEKWAADDKEVCLRLCPG